MQDIMRTAVVLLLQNNYDIFVPLQEPLCKELVVFNGDQLLRLLVRPVSATQQGPTVSTTIQRSKRAVLIEQLAADGILAVWPLNNEAWLIPMSAISTMQTIRLQNREDWLIQPVKRFDITPTVEMSSMASKMIKDKAISEKLIVDKEAEEQSYYERLLKGE